MSKPKFKVGDLVDVKGQIVRASGAVVLSVTVTEVGDTGSSGGTGVLKPLRAGEVYYKTTAHEGGSQSHQSIVFPHNPPSEFESMDALMDNLKTKQGEPA